MKKRCLCILLILCLVISTTACQGEVGNAAGEVVNPGEEAAPQLTILVSAHIYHWMKLPYFEAYIDKFKQQYGVKINFEQYGADYENAASELMTKLVTKGGPELILDDDNIAYKLIQQGAVLNVKGKIPNLENVYPNLIENETYYVPVGVEYNPILVRKDMLQELNLPVPELSWTAQDYYDIRGKWLQESQRVCTVYDLNEIVHRYLNAIEIFDYNHKKAYINTVDMKTALKDIKGEIFGGQYKLNKRYTYENYYNVWFEPDSTEFKDEWDLKKSEGYKEQHFRSYADEGRINALFARDIDLKSLSKAITLPNRLTDQNILWSIGFMVNQNGANLELSYEFINGMLSDESQIAMFEDKAMNLYPVNQAIEEEILSRERKENYSEETLQTKEFMLNILKNEEWEIYELRNEKEYDLYWRLVEDLFKYIFSDKTYSDSEISAELQKLKGKYDIYLNE